jgi:hypothetical protein
MEIERKETTKKGRGDLTRYLDEIVDPTIIDLENNRTSVRHTFLACVAVFHAIEYLAPGKSRNLRQIFRKESSDFATVDDVAHALKHVTAGRRDNPNLTATEVISRPAGKWGEAVWDLSRWDDPDGGVTFDRDRDVDLLDVVRRATAFLRKQTEVIQT